MMKMKRGTWDEDEMKIMKKIEKKKKQEKKEKKQSGHAEPHETLLNYLNEAAASNGKKPVDLANKRKKTQIHQEESYFDE